MMASLGMVCLGAFIGWIAAYGLVSVTDWSKPVNVLTGVISAAVAGSVFTFIVFLGGNTMGQALYFYPVGLLYGALINGLRFLPAPRNERYTLQWWLHVGGFALASVAMLGLLLCQPMRSLLPTL